MTLHLWLEGYRSELQKLGYDYSDEIIINDFFYEHDKTQIKYPDIDFDPFIQKVENYIIEHISKIKLYEGVHETLSKLEDNNITLALVSSSPRKLLKEVLEFNNLDKFFKIYLGFDDVANHKPDPEPFLKIIEIIKLDPKTTLVIGDSNNDIVAAKAARLDSCLFLPEENIKFYNFDKFKKEDPTFRVSDLKDFTNLLINI